MKSERSPKCERPTARAFVAALLAMLLIALTGCTTVAADVEVGRDLLTSGTIEIGLTKAAVAEHYRAIDPAADPEERLEKDVDSFTDLAPKGLTASLHPKHDGYSIIITIKDVKLRPLAAQGGGTFFSYINPRVDVVKGKYLFKTRHPALAVFRTDDFDTAIGQMHDSISSMTMSVTLPGRIVQADHATTIDGRTATFDLTKVDTDLIRVVADPPAFPWASALLLPVVLALIIGAAVVTIRRLTKTASGQTARA